MKKDFQKLIWDFYKKNKRTFPWRETTNPYFIFLSEIMLQQTRTVRVVEKYTEFIHHFPTVTSLANAPFSEVLRHWSGLGYNRRAKYLHDAAKIIVTKHNGEFPADTTLLDELPGIGTNTAAAIVVYSFNIPIAFIETNIRRIYIHHFFHDKETISDQELFPLIEETMDKEHPREWFWALMDYGSYLPKVIVNPNRKSKHYIKQSPFKGSVRQVRGSVLRILIEKGPMKREKLYEKIEGNKEHFTEALNGLIKDKQVKKDDGFISIV